MAQFPAYSIDCKSEDDIRIQEAALKASSALISELVDDEAVLVFSDVIQAMINQVDVQQKKVGILELSLKCWTCYLTVLQPHFHFLIPSSTI